MNLLKNIYKSPMRNILLGIAVLIPSAFLSLCIFILGGIGPGMQEERRELGNEVRFQQTQAGQTAGTEVTERLADRLALSNYVEDVHFSLKLNVLGDYQPILFQADTITIAPKGGRKERSLFPLVGSSGLMLYPDFRSSKLAVTAGRAFLREELKAGAAVAVISRSLAEKNNWDLGSEFAIEAYGGKTRLQLQVVGLFEERSASGYDPRQAYSANMIFVPLELARKIRRTSYPAFRRDVLTEASYYLDDPLHVDAFRKEADALGLSGGAYRLDARDEEYRSNTQSLRKLKNDTVICSIAAGMVGLVVLSACLGFSLKKRGKEISFLRIIGLSKGSIATRMTVEALIVLILSFSLGIWAGRLAAEPFSTYVLERVETQSAWSVGSDGNPMSVAMGYAGPAEVKVKRIPIGMGTAQAVQLGVSGVTAALWGGGVLLLGIYRKEGV